MDNDKKRDPRSAGSSEMLPAIDSANRARNRTVMLTPEMTGQMRARLGGDFEPLGPNQTGRPTEGTSDNGWEDPNRLAIGGRTPAAEDDDAEWARPIEPAIMTDSDSPNGRYDDSPLTDEEPSSWQSTPPERAEPEPMQESRPRVVRPAAPPMMGSRSQNEESVQEYAPRTPQPSASSRPQSAPPMFGGRMESRPPEPRSYEEPPAPRRAPAPAPAPAQPQRSAEERYPVGDRPEEVFWKNMTPLVGFLVTFDHDPLGTYVELRSGRLIVTSEAEANGNCLVINDSSVSPMHAIMRVGGGPTIQILDQLSENGTRIRRVGIEDEELLSGEKSTLSHGDVVMFGERKYHVCLLNMSVG